MFSMFSTCRAPGKIAASMSLLGLMIFASPVSAATYNFYCITGNNAGDCAIGEAAFQVDVTDAGGGFVDFTFTRNSTESANLSEVYFDDGTLLGLSSITSGTSGSTAVAFTGGSASPPDLPGGESISPAFNVTAGFLADADNPAPSKGVNENEDWLTITFELLAGKTFVDTIAAMGTDLRIGIHVTAFDSGGSESLIAPPPVVPVPAAAWLFGSALGLMGWMRRKVCA